MSWFLTTTFEFLSILHELAQMHMQFQKGVTQYMDYSFLIIKNVIIMAAWWLALLPHTNKVLGLILPSGRAFMCRVCMFS